MLWQPDETRRRQTLLWQFATATRDLHGVAPEDYFGLHAWSVRERADFWNAVWDHCGAIGDKCAGRLLYRDAMPGAQFFPDARLNYAENLLRRSGPEPALIFRGEDGSSAQWSWDVLATTVSRLQQGLVALGLGPGDRVAAMLPNVPEAIALMLATASIGAVWSSCSPDFGPAGVLDRFSQITPKLFIAADGYRYNGRVFDIGDTVRSVAAELRAPTLILDQLGRGRALAGTIDSGTTYAEFTGRHAPPAAALHPAALRPSAVHPVLVGHHRQTQMHRAWGRGHAAAAPQGASASLRHPPWRSRALLHHAAAG